MEDQVSRQRKVRILDSGSFLNFPMKWQDEASCQLSVSWQLHFDYESLVFVRIAKKLMFFQKEFGGVHKREPAHFTFSPGGANTIW